MFKRSVMFLGINASGSLATQGMAEFAGGAWR